MQIRRSLKGYTLTELAIVFGIAGAMLSGLWATASMASQSWSADDAANELETIQDNISQIMTGRQLPNALWGANITPRLIASKSIPAGYINQASPTTVDNPWSAGSGPNWSGVVVWGINSNTYRVSFYKTTQKGCIGLLAAATQCWAGQTGCPKEIYTNWAFTSCQPNQAGCTGTPTATGTGWRALGGMAEIISLCQQNPQNSGSVEFDYST